MFCCWSKQNINDNQKKDLSSDELRAIESDVSNAFTKKEFEYCAGLDEGVYFGQFNRLGQRHGYGIYITKHTNTYCGQWKNDVREGLGSWETFGVSKVFDCVVVNFVLQTTTAGSWKDNKQTGKGVQIKTRESKKSTFNSVYKHNPNNYSDFKYVGDLNDGKREGSGQLTYADGEKYSGQFKNGQYHGRGTLTTSSGQVFEGTFTQGVWDGDWTGTQTNDDGDIAKGHWFLNHLNGQGEIVRVNGDIEEGLFLNGRLNGPGRSFHAASGDEYTGNFLHGLKWGEGTLRRGSDGVSVSGVWFYDTLVNDMVK